MSLHLINDCNFLFEGILIRVKSVESPKCLTSYSITQILLSNMHMSNQKFSEKATNLLPVSGLTRFSSPPWGNYMTKNRSSQLYTVSVDLLL